MFPTFRAYYQNFRTLWIPPFGIICLYLFSGYIAVALTSYIGSFIYFLPVLRDTPPLRILEVSLEQPFPCIMQIIIGLFLVATRGLIAVSHAGERKEFLGFLCITVGIGVILSSTQIVLKGWIAIFGLGFWYFLGCCLFYELGRFLINKRYYPEEDD